MTEVVEREMEVAGLRTHYREARDDDGPNILYVHGVPTASWDWLAHLERTGGIAPDLPGFGSSEKPPGFDYSIAGYDRWLEGFVDGVGMERFSLVVHDWGVVGLALAQRFPERIERLVVYASVPFLPGYHWHWVARIWRRPVMGELFMATSSKWGFKQIHGSRTRHQAHCPHGSSTASGGTSTAGPATRFWACTGRRRRRSSPVPALASLSCGAPP